MIKTNELGKNFVEALRVKYLAEMKEAKANLSVYSTNITGIGEHSDLMKDFDVWIDKYTNAKDKLASLEELFILDTKQMIKG